MSLNNKIIRIYFNIVVNAMQQVILDEISFFVLNLQEICKIKA